MTKHLIGRAAAAALIVTMAAGAGGPTHAQSNVCSNLESQLASLDSGFNAGSQSAFQEYDQSVRQQRRELDQITAQARRQRCTGLLLFSRRSDSGQCRQMRATIDRMRQNLDRLVVARNRYTNDPNATARQRDEILRAMAANGCRTAHARVRQAPRAGSLLDALFGTSRMRGIGESQFFRGSGGTYRTLCVRACDGYYFPISFSTVPQQFATDEMACRARCPGSDVALYVHRNPGEEVEQMTSLAGQPYTALPTAFQHRQEYNPACGCGGVALPAAGLHLQPAPALASLNPGFDTLAVLPPQPLVPLPPQRPTRFEDPETLANRAGDLVFQRTVAGDATTEVATLAERNGVRVVGPEVYFAQETNTEALIPGTGRAFRREREAEVGPAGSDS